jgi:hypothetical protein
VRGFLNTRNEMKEVKLSFRQVLEKELYILEDEFKLLWDLRHNHDLMKALREILVKIKEIKKLLELHPKIICPNCNKKIN